MPVFQLSDALVFPRPELAREDGLLAVGGDLSAPRLLLAYRMGIFPWYSPGDPILWWAPDPRLVLFPTEFHCPKRLARKIRQNIFHLTMDTAFPSVVRECAQVRLESGEATWIDEKMIQAYTRLHELGQAHSMECWQGGTLVGGLYGVAIGSAFFGESMFSRATDSSKVALASLVEQLKAWNFELMDCQVRSEHLVRLGAKEVAGPEFYRLLAESTGKAGRRGKWTR